MAHSIDDHIRCGATHGHTLFAAVEAERGELAAHAFLAGLVHAAADYNTRLRGSLSTFELMTGIAERVIDPLVAVRCIETDLHAFVKKNSGEKA